MGVDISYHTVSAHDPFSVCKYIFDAKKNNENISKSAFNKKNFTKFMKEKSQMCFRKTLHERRNVKRKINIKKKITRKKM